MARGKETCRILKDIRRQIAEANDIAYITSECRYKGDCLGTCPKCEAEVRYLEQQLRARSLAGKAVKLAGISATALAMPAPMTADAQTLQDSTTFIKESIPVVTTDTITVNGIVSGEYTLPNDSVSTELLIGACIFNPRTGKGTVTDIDGKFSIPTCIGDTLEISYVGYETQKIVVTEAMRNVTITLVESQEVLGELAAGSIPLIKKDKHYIDFYITDGAGDLIDTDDIEITSIRTDSDGEEDYEDLDLRYIDEKHPCRIFWNYYNGLQDENGCPLKEATLRIEAEGYEEPIIIKVKYPKRHSKKTIRFKHNKRK